jgi:4-amino-4-deoxy-L-arabinose transferase-like glycosyltransferase
MTLRAPKPDKETKMVSLFLVAYFIVLSLTTINIDRMMGDAGNHATAGLFVHEVASTWMSNPFMPLSELKATAIGHHMHYKSFASFLTYTPLHFIFMGTVFILFGASRFAALLPTMFESLVLLYFLYKLSKLSYGDKKIAFLTIFIIAFNPLYFFLSTNVMLEIGSSMFMVMTIYYFSLYLMKNTDKQLYMAAILLALSILTRPTMVLVIPVLFLTLIWEKRPPWIRQNLRQLLFSVFILFLFMSPWLIGFLVLHAEGLSGSFLGKWLGHAGGYEMADVEGFPIADGTLSYHAGLPFYKTMIYLVSSVLYQWYLIPFFLLAFYLLLKNVRKLNVVEKQSVLVILVFSIYLTWISLAGMRYIFPIFPFVGILVAKPLFTTFKRLGHPVMIVILILAVAQCSHFLMNIENTQPHGDFDGTSIFILDDTTGETSVITSQPRAQAFSFALLDHERRIYTFYMPGTKNELESMIEGSYSDQEWERFGIKYPPVGYIVAHEDYTTKMENDYDLLEFLRGQTDFGLVKTIEGDRPGTRTFIYKREQPIDA